MSTNNGDRACWVGAPAIFRLQQACAILWHCFDHDDGNLGVYQVGSSLERRDFRDVDVRMILRDDAYDRFFPGAWAGELDATWSLFCSGVSRMLSDASGLPVDFQVQRSTQANAKYDGRPRNPIGIFPSSAPRGALP